MNTKKVKLIALSALGLGALLALAGSLHIADAAPRDALAERLQRLEDREQILELLTAYGASLDRRDFDPAVRADVADAVFALHNVVMIRNSKSEIRNPKQN